MDKLVKLNSHPTSLETNGKKKKIGEAQHIFWAGRIADSECYALELEC